MPDEYHGFLSDSMLRCNKVIIFYLIFTAKLFLNDTGDQLI